jgi:hypothetical protein
MRLDGRLATVRQLTSMEREQMFGLMQLCYERVERDAFEDDLSEKHWVILLAQSGGGPIRGFSTQVLWQTAVDGHPLQALFSGDTVIAPDAWGDTALPRVWGRLALSLIDRDPHLPLVWFLISKGYKTYRFLPLFFHEYYPCRHVATPVWARSAMAALAGRKFADRFDAEHGVIRADGNSARLRPGVADITPPRMQDPDVRYFVESNPSHAEGDELCCLAPLTRANLKPAAYRVIGNQQPITLRNEEKQTADERG